MRATVVVDNRKSDALPGEWGLCIYIEYGERKLLLDTGASELFAENAEKLGLDLSAVDAAVLSRPSSVSSTRLCSWEKSSGCHRPPTRRNICSRRPAR